MISRKENEKSPQQTLLELSQHIFKDLPVEIIFLIIKYFDFKDVAKLSSLNKFMRESTKKYMLDLLADKVISEEKYLPRTYGELSEIFNPKYQLQKKYKEASCTQTREVLLFMLMLAVIIMLQQFLAITFDLHAMKYTQHSEDNIIPAAVSLTGWVAFGFFRRKESDLAQIEKNKIQDEFEKTPKIYLGDECRFYNLHL